VFLILDDLIRHRFVADDLAVVNANDAPRVAGDLRIVRDEDDGDALLAIKPLEDGHDLRA
jgi:hypothetical protein